MRANVFCLLSLSCSGGGGGGGGVSPGNIIRNVRRRGLEITAPSVMSCGKHNTLCIQPLSQI